MKFDLTKTDIESIINLIDNHGDNKPDLNHIKNLLLNRRGSKSYTKSELINEIIHINKHCDIEYLQEMDDKSLYLLLLELENDEVEIAYSVRSLGTLENVNGQLVVKNIRDYKTDMIKFKKNNRR